MDSSEETRENSGVIYIYIIIYIIRNWKLENNKGIQVENHLKLVDLSETK